MERQVKSKYKYIAGRIYLSERKYEMIEKAVHILEENGFVFSRVRAEGDTSNDMGTMGFDKTYHSLAEFYENAEKDFAKEREELRNWGCSMCSWEESRFILVNEEKDTTICIIVQERNGETNREYATFNFHGMRDFHSFDVDYAEIVKQKVEDGLKEVKNRP